MAFRTEKPARFGPHGGGAHFQAAGGEGTGGREARLSGVHEREPFFEREAVQPTPSVPRKVERVIDVIAADEPGLFAASVFALQDVQTGSLRQGEHLVNIGTDDDLFSAEQKGGVPPAALTPTVRSH